jgi:hypothetical protein
MGGTEIAPAELAAMESVRLCASDRRAVQEYWERVIEECRAEVAQAPRPTSALLDGSAAERRRRRRERRAVVAVVRELPVRRAVSGPDGREVA